MNNTAKTTQKYLYAGYLKHVKKTDLPPCRLSAIIYRDLAKRCELRRSLKITDTISIMAFTSAISQKQTHKILIRLKESGVFEECTFSSDGNKVTIQLKDFNNVN